MKTHIGCFLPFKKHTRAHLLLKNIHKVERRMTSFLPADNGRTTGWLQPLKIAIKRCFLVPFPPLPTKLTKHFQRKQDVKGIFRTLPPFPPTDKNRLDSSKEEKTMHFLQHAKRLGSPGDTRPRSTSSAAQHALTRLFDIHACRQPARVAVDLPTTKIS